GLVAERGGALGRLADLQRLGFAPGVALLSPVPDLGVHGRSRDFELVTAVTILLVSQRHGYSERFRRYLSTREAATADRRRNPEMAERASTEVEAPRCAPPDPEPHPPKAKFPPLACDCHAHICGPQATYGYIPERIYTPPDALLPVYRHLLT